MSFIITLPPIIGAMVFALISLAITLALFFLVRLFFRRKRTESTGVFAQRMAARIGTMHALVVALVFSGLTAHWIHLYQISDTEAMSAANVYWALENIHTSEAVELRKLMPEYLKAVIEKDWNSPSGSAKNPPAWELITKMRAAVRKWNPSFPADETTRNYVFNNINAIAESREKRIIERNSRQLPVLFWIIAVSGYFLTLIPYFTIEYSKNRIFLVSCYAIIIGVMFYGIAVLERPFSGKMMHPTAFELMLVRIEGRQ